jgi:hypothetical protein
MSHRDLKPELLNAHSVPRPLTRGQLTWAAGVDVPAGGGG